MPIGSWGDNDRPLLSGLFGVFQSAGAARQSTADLWSTLRVAAATWQFQAQGGGDLPTATELEATGAQILKDQGIGIQQVNTYRALSNQWRTAKGNLTGAELDQQITSQMIFQPPWARTTDTAVPSRYRIRMQFTAEDGGGTEFTTWGTFELQDPLTSIGDALNQATALVGKKPTSDTPIGATVTGVNDYEIEQI